MLTWLSVEHNEYTFVIKLSSKRTKVYLIVLLDLCP